MLEKPSRGVIYSRKLCEQIEQIALHQARWCNWLTRRPLKAESTGSSPVRAINDHTFEGGRREPPFSFKAVIFRCEWLFLQVLHCFATERKSDGATWATGRRGEWESREAAFRPILPFAPSPRRPRLCFCDLCGYKLNASFTNCACSSW